MLREGLNKIWSFGLDCLFPQACLGCGQEDIFLCSNCRDQAGFLLKSAGVFRCPVCGVNSKQGMVCNRCQNQSELEQVIALTNYQSGTVQAELIEYLKYHFSPEASLEIKAWLKNNQELLLLLSKTDLIVPIPLHKRRYAERGFNQAEGIAQVIAQILAKPLKVDCLKRVKATKQQAKLNRAERISNVAAAFVCAEPKLVINKNVLLIDDVYTTGATMQAAAQALHQMGAGQVAGFTLARGNN